MTDGDSDDETRSLYHWFADDLTSSRQLSPSLVECPPASGDMGISLEALQFVTGNGWSAASFVMSLLAWRRTRPNPSEITLKRGETTITLKNFDHNELLAAIDALEQSERRSPE
ncbi:effector-associated constant component EACC1 [Streptomyces sp. NPDC004012]